MQKQSKNWPGVQYPLNISKIGIFGKNAWFSGNTLFTETIPQGVLIIIEGGKVQYITKQKEKMCLPWQVDF